MTFFKVWFNLIKALKVTRKKKLRISNTITYIRSLKYPLDLRNTSFIVS